MWFDGFQISSILINLVLFKIKFFLSNWFIHLTKLLFLALCEIIIIDANFFPLKGFWINLFTEILFFAIILVIDDNTPFLSRTSKRIYDENTLFDKSIVGIFFLLRLETDKGNFIFPLNIEHMSETKAEVVAPGPAPSPWITNLPIGFPSTITAFSTLLTFMELLSPVWQ